MEAADLSADRQRTAPRPTVPGWAAALLTLACVALAFWVRTLNASGVLDGRPLYTPTVLGTAIFRGGAGLDDPGALTPSLEMVLSFTWIHTLVFVLVGIAAAWLIALAERDSNYGFGIVILFAIFEAGFVFACMLFFEPVLQALAWPAVVAGNLLAAATMAAVFWRGHRSLAVQP